MRGRLRLRAIYRRTNPRAEVQPTRRERRLPEQSGRCGKQNSRRRGGGSSSNRAHIRLLPKRSRAGLISIPTPRRKRPVVVESYPTPPKTGVLSVRSPRRWVPIRCPHIPRAHLLPHSAPRRLESLALKPDRRPGVVYVKDLGRAAPPLRFIKGDGSRFMRISKITRFLVRQ